MLSNHRLLCAAVLLACASLAPAGLAGAAKLTIIDLEGRASAFEAPENPKELLVEKPVEWTKHPDSKSDQPHVEFAAAQGRTLSFELTFDGFKTDTDVHLSHVTPLMNLARVQDPNGAEDKKRPPRVKVVLGSFLIEGVVTSVTARYTMFNAAGNPVRAVCPVKVREASRASYMKKR